MLRRDRVSGRIGTDGGAGKFSQACRLPLGWVRFRRDLNSMVPHAPQPPTEFWFPRRRRREHFFPLPHFSQHPTSSPPPSHPPPLPRIPFETKPHLIHT